MTDSRRLPAATFIWRETLTAPAKVNLLLLVGPPRADSYHNIFSVMAPLDLHDSLEVEVEVSGGVDPRARNVGGPRGDAGAGEGRVTGGGVDRRARRWVEGPAGAGATTEVQVVCPGVASESNLVNKALRAVAEATGCGFRGTVRIAKRIPMAAGMGGGSSDAAAALAGAACAALEAGGRVIEPPELVRMAAGLGADVPFFLGGGPQVASGVGEQLQPISVPALPLLLLLPEEELSTPAVYRAFDDAVGGEDLSQFAARAAGAESDWRELEKAWVNGQLDREAAGRAVARLMRNDLERAAYRLVPDLLARRVLLEGNGALSALVSGSGPAMFGVFRDPSAVEQACAEAVEMGRNCVPAWTLA